MQIPAALQSALPPAAKQSTPELKPEVRRDILVEQALTQDALLTLGSRPISRHAAEQALLQDRIGVAVGHTVQADHRGDTWTVIGSTNGKVDVARLVDGTLERKSAPFASFAEYSQSLLQSPATLDGRTAVDLLRPYVAAANEAAKAGKPVPPLDPSTLPDLWIPSPQSMPTVAQEGRNARVTMVNFTEAASGDDTPETFETSWDDVLKMRRVDELRPVAQMPSSIDDAIALRKLTGDTRMVTSGIGQQDQSDRERLVGTNSQPALGKAVLDEAATTVEWFHAKAGVDVLPKGQTLVMHENNPEYLANASAGGHGGVTNINEGPHDENLRQKWLHELSGKAGQAIRGVNKMIRANQDTVLNHEWGHALRGVHWGEVFPNVQRAEDLTPEQLNQYFEHGMVNEAMSDLYGVARSGEPNMGIRKVHATDRFSANYEQYRAMLEASPVDNKLDEHYGTQLITKPAMEILKAHGGDALANITGAADMSIAKRFKEGEIEVVTAPLAANELYNAAARRFGADDAGVRAMQDGFAKLKLPVTLER